MSSLGHTCYSSGPIPLLPDGSIPGQNPAQTQGTPPPVPVTQPGAEIRTIVGTCYGPALPLTPSTDIPPYRQGEQTPPPTIDPGETIRTIVARCYPPIIPDPPGPPPDGPPPPVIDIPDFCSLVPWADMGLDIPPFCGDFPIIITPPSPPPDLPPWWGKGADCKRLAPLLSMDPPAARKHEDWNQGAKEPPEGKKFVWVVLRDYGTGTDAVRKGEELICDNEQHPLNPDWGDCVKDAIECLFKPYVTGTWKPPTANCETHYFRGQNSTTGKICIKNCFPDRMPIYEYRKGTPVGNIQIMPFGRGFHNRRFVTTRADGTWNERKVRCEGGNRVFNSTATQTQTFTANGLTVTVKVTPIDDGGEYDSSWWVESWSGTMPAIGTTWEHSWNAGKGTVYVKVTVVDGAGSGQDHAYGRETVAPAGYDRVHTGPAFYILQYPERGTVPLYKFYSPTTVDTMLTTNPGAPDTEGAGERATMDAAGMTQGEILGYAFKNKEDAIAYLGEDEQVVELHRYFANSISNSAYNDHMYSIQSMGTETPPKYGTRQTYTLPTNPKTSYIVAYKMMKPAASYKNSWGVVIHNKECTEIYWTKTIESNVNQNSEFKQFEVPLSVLKTHAGKEMGFYLVPDGHDYGVTNNDSPSFYVSGDGWKRTGGSAQSDWVFFSDPQMNPGNRNKTKWVGNNWQWWEDLLAGDDDYDDFKVHYEVLAPGGAYYYEGVQCYVFKDPAPEKIMIDIVEKDGCSTNIFDGIFDDILLTRSECGPLAPPTTWTAESSIMGCGTCTGDYVNDQNREQTLNVLKTATLQLKSFGCIISAPEQECMVFRFLVKKNGVNVVDETYELATFPFVGNNLGNAFTVTKDDTVTFRLESIDSGPYFGNASVNFIFLANNSEFSGSWSARLGTISADENIAGRSEAYASNPYGGGSIKKMSVEVWDHERNEWSTSVACWDNGQLNTNNANGQTADWSNVYFSGNTWNCSGLDPCPAPYYENGTTDRNGHILTTRINADGNTTNDGIQYDKLFGHSRGLIMKAAEPNVRNNSDLGNMTDWVHHSIGDGYTSWFINKQLSKAGNAQTAIDDIDAVYSAGIQAWNGGVSGSPYVGSYSKMAFFHDYLLGSIIDGTWKTLNPPSGKVRMAFWPYADEGDNDARDRWGCAIEVFGLVNAGTNYRQGDQFELVWPPYQPNNYQALPGSTPYFPKDDPNYSFPDRLELLVRGENNPEEFTPREAFYQESHNRDSNVWLLCQHKLDRVRFRITIDEITT